MNMAATQKIDALRISSIFTFMWHGYSEYVGVDYPRHTCPWYNVYLFPKQMCFHDSFLFAYKRSIAISGTVQWIHDSWALQLDENETQNINIDMVQTWYVQSMNGSSTKSRKSRKHYEEICHVLQKLGNKLG